MPKRKKPEHDLIQAVREMVSHRCGELSLSTRKVTPPDNIDVASIRKNLGYNQKQFADHFGFALSAIKDWEQKRRKPERAARVFLSVIAINPEAVEQALESLS
jgi:putative transcriptional regulator